MNATTRIQIKFGEPMTPQQIPVRQASATASRLPGVASVDAGPGPGYSTRQVGSHRRGFGTEQLIARIRAVLGKEGI